VQQVVGIYFWGDNSKTRNPGDEKNHYLHFPEKEEKRKIPCLCRGLDSSPSQREFGKVFAI